LTRSRVAHDGHELQPCRVVGDGRLERRTAASLMVGAGVSRLVVSKILNHVETGVTAVYDRHSYDREERAALDLWGQRVGRLVENRRRGNVVAFAHP
jgi:hypothetical protein